MEEEGDWSSARRRPQGRVIFADGSIRAEWESLQPELVQLIADCVLSTGGFNEYMGMRAVCPSWRSAVAKPSLLDLHFSPWQWVMVDLASKDEGPLFLNITTGRFRRLRGPVLRDYIFVGASEGFLVLGERERPQAARVLNPLTGDMLPFAAIPREPEVEIAIVGSQPTIIFSFIRVPAYSPLQRVSDSEAAYLADPTGQIRAVKFHSDAACNEENWFDVMSMVTYAGNVYMLTTLGMLCRVFCTSGHWYAERILEIDIYDTGALVESAGKLLLFRDDFEIAEVFSVDVNQKALQSIENIGSGVLFLRSGKCMVLDADKLPSIDGNCIYSTEAGNKFVRMYMRYDLSDGKREYVTCPQVPQHVGGAESGIIYEGPSSLAQVLLTPYPDVIDQLDRIDQA